MSFFHLFPMKGNRISPNEILKHLDLLLNILCRRNQAERDAEPATLGAKCFQIFDDCTLPRLAVSKGRLMFGFIYSENCLYALTPCSLFHFSKDGNGLFGCAVKG